MQPPLFKYVSFRGSKLLDFGIAKWVKSYGSPSTETGLRPMTPDYASPEQLRGDPITRTSDIYSLGFLLYDLLTGNKPYQTKGKSLAQLLRVVCEQDPPKPSKSVLENHPGAAMVNRAYGAGDSKKSTRFLAGDLNNIVLKALDKEPRRRYSSAQ